MVFVYIGSTGDSAGHSIVTWALARRLTALGLRVGFMKSIGTPRAYSGDTWADPDARLFKEVLDLREPLEHLCPFMSSEDAVRLRDREELLEDLMSRARLLARDKDVLLIMGCKDIFLDETAHPVPDITLAGRLDASFLLIHRYRKRSTSVYSTLSVSSLLGDTLKGIVVNRVTADRWEEVHGGFIPDLAARGIPVVAALPEDPVLSFKSVRQIAEALDGRVLCGEGFLDQPVGAMTVGSSDLEKELLIFRRVYNKIVLLSPPSGDEGRMPEPIRRHVAAVVLTGGRHPAPRVLQAAQEARIALVEAPLDTFAALDRVERYSCVLCPSDAVKAGYLEDILSREGALDRLLHTLVPEAR